MDKDFYFANKGNKCPFCKTNKTIFYTGEIDGHALEIYVVIECTDCKKRWTEIARITDIETTEDQCNEQ